MEPSGSGLISPEGYIALSLFTHPMTVPLEKRWQASLPEIALATAITEASRESGKPGQAPQPRAANRLRTFYFAVFALTLFIAVAVQLGTHLNVSRASAARTKILARQPANPSASRPAARRWSGYIGGGRGTGGYGIAVDSSGNAYVTGYTSSAEDTFPVTVGPDLTILASASRWTVRASLRHGMDRLRRGHVPRNRRAGPDLQRGY